MVAPSGRVMLFKRLVRPRWLRWTVTAAALDRQRQGAGKALRRQEACAGVEAHLDLSADRGDGVAVYLLQQEVGQAVAVDVDEVLFRAGLALGRGDAAAERIGGQSEPGVALKAFGRGALHPEAGRVPDLRLAEPVAEVEHDGEAAARRLHKIRQPVAVDVDQVPLRCRRAMTSGHADADIVGGLFTVGVEAEETGRRAQRRGGGAEGDVIAFDRALTHLAGASEADAPAIKRAVRQRRLNASTADDVRIAVAVEIDEVDVGRTRAVGCPNAEDRERDLLGSVRSAAGFDDALCGAKAGAVGKIEVARAEPGRPHERVRDERVGVAALPTVLDLEWQHAHEVAEDLVGLTG